MPIKHVRIYGLLLMLCCLGACSTKKNTAATRSYHQTKVRYNIFYNGNIAYEEGLRAIQSAADDDYSAPLNLYPVSDHQAAQAATMQMERTIEKCRKCIKLHSIKSRPKPDPRKSGDPKYKQWLKQEEFNAEMRNVWIRLAEAEFHKGDFMGAISTLRYVIRHYEYDADIVARCQLWIARAYAELGWMYEAEDVLSKVAVDNLSRKHAWLYSAVSADIMLKNHRYREAIPFLKIALPHEKRRVYRPRFQFVLAQLYQQEGNRDAAIDAYKAVLHLSPEAEMEFHARLNMSVLQGVKAIRSLERMARLPKHDEQLDMIYNAIGDIYRAAADTARAMEYYLLAIEKSTQAGAEKAAILVKAGDIAYHQHDYVVAQPLYQEAVTLLNNESDDYRRLQRLSENLDELIIHLGTIQLQDSLQALSRLSEEEQLAVAERIVAELIEQEKREEEEALQAEREARNNPGLQGVDTRNMLGGGGAAAEWYFYNQQLLKSGKQDFARRWGNRPLEDNWRRKTKTPAVTMLSSQDENDDLQAGDAADTDSTATAAAALLDIHQPQYYLQQIPRTEEDLHLSDSLIATALYNVVYIYEEKMEDMQQADDALSQFETRFADDPRLPDIYFSRYLGCIKRDDEACANHYRQLIRSRFPDTKEAAIVSDPDYFERLRRMALEQDSLYERTYKAYCRGQFKQVKQNAAYAADNYPFSKLMPRFMFLNAIAVARTEGQDAFAESLRQLVESYSESELGAMAKDMLAMMGQGMESKKGKMSTSTLTEKRGDLSDNAEQTAEEKQLTRERKLPSVVLLYLDKTDEALANQLLYQTALFNFSQFLIRDFDMLLMADFAGGTALRINGFDSMDEAEWYIGLVEKNTDFIGFLRDNNIQLIPIVEDNLSLIGTKYSISDYMRTVTGK